LENKIKSTSYEYGVGYQNKQIQKYKERANNHWKYRLDVFHKLLNNNVLPGFEDCNKSEIVVVDIGCSIGTFALEAAKNGYNSTGIDFDNEAIKIAKKLAKEENVNVNFICGDISQNIDFNDKIDIAVCFDIFEHLHDDELGAFLLSIKKRLSRRGILLYHTFPTQYDYIFFKNKLVLMPLVLFVIFGKNFFNKVVLMYAATIDFFLILFKGKPYKELIKNKSHCNPTTKKRLSDILKRAGFENKLMEEAQLYKFAPTVQRLFKKHSISYRNLYGVAYQKDKV